MLNTAELKPGMQCLYKRQVLTYKRSDAAVTHPYHVFTTRRGTEKRLSQPTTEREVWIEVTTIETITPKDFSNGRLSQ